jgi:hypothetical protein
LALILDDLTAAAAIPMLNQMVKFSGAPLDRTFAAGLHLSWKTSPK